MNTSTGVSNALQAAVVAVVNTLGGLLVAFGVGLSDAQLGSVVGFVNAVLVIWFLFRHSKVTKAA